ncbi:hypothetical protein KR018_005289 [Drosophila ironensis]|nr:hypothetical protein KR018_005289 [Drosophila ironensis]
MLAGRFLRRFPCQRSVLAGIACLRPLPGLVSARTPSNAPITKEIHPQRRCYGSSVDAGTESHLDSATYERVCSETLDALCDYFEELTESAQDLPGSDVAYGDGVLTVKLGGQHGTYVINRQTPNKQIWLSSPTSGPKRFDFVGSRSKHGGKWIYKHSGQTLHELLQAEIPAIVKGSSVDFLQLPYCS